jgi:hypothetical protein
MIRDASFKGNLIDHVDESDDINNFKSIPDTKNLHHLQNNNREGYVFSIFSAIFRGDIPADLIKKFSNLFIKYLECENKFFYRNKINEELYILLSRAYHNDINKLTIILNKIQDIIKSVQDNNSQFKIDLFRIERFFMNLVLSKYTTNLLRGHRR